LFILEWRQKTKRTITGKQSQSKKDEKTRQRKIVGNLSGLAVSYFYKSVVIQKDKKLNQAALVPAGLLLN